ncbi:hypothetical protein [Streptomyces prasinosporus]
MRTWTDEGTKSLSARCPTYSTNAAVVHGIGTRPLPQDNPV